MIVHHQPPSPLVQARSMTGYNSTHLKSSLRPLVMMRFGLRPSGFKLLSIPVRLGLGQRVAMRTAIGTVTTNGAGAGIKGEGDVATDAAIHEGGDGERRGAGRRGHYCRCGCEADDGWSRRRKTIKQTQNNSSSSKHKTGRGKQRVR